jgi:hypothetical protein
LRVAFWECGTARLYWAVFDLPSGPVWVSPMETCARPRIDNDGNIHWLDVDEAASTIKIYSCDTEICQEDDALPFKTCVWSERRALLGWSGFGPRQQVQADSAPQ